MILTQFISPSPTINPSQRWMLRLLMPAVMGFSLWRYASGLSLYWLTGNLINLLIQLAINRSKMGKEMYALALPTVPRSPPNSSKNEDGNFFRRRSFWNGQSPASLDFSGLHWIFH